MVIGFSIWMLCCIICFAVGVYALKAKRPVGFWNVLQEIEVSDLHQYNKAVAVLWFVFAIILGLLGIPLLAGQNSSLITVTILGTVFLCIFFMVVYMRIEGKYRIR